MPRSTQPYRQYLPALDLSIERMTARVPDDGYWYVRRGNDEIGRFRSLKDARAEWDRVVEASGWTPERRAVDPNAAILVRSTGERTTRWAAPTQDGLGAGRFMVGRL